MRALILALSVGACVQGTTGATSLVTTDAEPPGPNCANGGVAISSGVDDNGDGALDPGEVDTVSYVCQTPAPTQLVRVDPEPDGANCAHGGQAIKTGTDLDGDGTLDPNEVASVSYVCTGGGGAMGFDALVRVDPDPAANGHCANGGQAIKTGLDLDRDGILDDAEVTATSYVCSGPVGPQPLIRIDLEPNGAHCATGGDAIHVGIDTNQDGSLQNAEIQSTSYLCNDPNPTVVEGDVSITNTFDAIRMVGVQQVTGALSVAAPLVSTLDLSALRTVGGGLSIDRAYGNTLTIPNLTSVGGDARFSNIGTMLTLPRLTSVGGQAMFSKIDVVRVPALVSVGADLGFDVLDLRAPALTSAGSVTFGLDPLYAGYADLPALLQTGAINVVGSMSTVLHLDALVQCASLDTRGVQIVAPQLKTITGRLRPTGYQQLSLPALESVGAELEFDHIVGQSLQFPKLATVGGHLFFYYVQVSTFAMPVLTSVGGEVRLDQNGAFVTNLPQLTTAGDFTSFGCLFSLPSLTTVGDLYLRQLGYAAVTLPALTTANDVTFQACPNLTTITMPITSVARDMTFSNMPRLPTCRAQQLVAAGHPMTYTITGTNNAGTCP